MKDLLQHIASKEYLGRMFAIGKTTRGEDVVVYAVTGRSDSSRARRLEEEWVQGRVRTSVTDPEQLKKGNPALLLYNAIVLTKNGDLVVSNGAQTDLIVEACEKYDLHCGCEDKRLCGARPYNELGKAFARPVLVFEGIDEKGNAKYIDITSFEPDPPNWTPRISGISGRGGHAVSIIKKKKDSDDGQQARYGLALKQAEGKVAFVSTYEGTNVPKGEVIPSFEGNEPLYFEFEFDGESPEQVADSVYDALGPKTGPGILEPGKDFRVGVTAVFYQRYPRPLIRSFTKNFHPKPKFEEEVK